MQNASLSEAKTRPFAENVLIVLFLAGGLAILGVAWMLGDASEAARAHQWELAFLGLSALLAGQWIVAASPAARRQQTAGAAAALALAGVGVETYYGVGWAPSTPFIVSFVAVFLAAETFAFVGRNGQLVRGATAYVRLAAVGWNCAWGLVNIDASYMQLPDVVNLFIAFSWLWTAASAIIVFSELTRLSGHAPSRSSEQPGAMTGAMGRSA